jgi:hypothetical protein
MTFADNYNIRSSQLSGANIAAALDALTNAYVLDQWSATNTTSAATVDVSGASGALTSATGEIILLCVQINLSHSTAGVKSNIVIDVDGASQVTGYFTAHANDTGGDEATLCLNFISALSPGAHTIKARWNTPSGTLYTDGGTLFGITLQNT